MEPEADHKDKDQSSQVHQVPLVAIEVATDGPGRTLRKSRRLSERDILSQLRAWLLEEYVASYCRTLASTRIFRRCYWIDALDGATRAQLTAATVEKGKATTTAASGHKRKKGAAQTLDEYPPVLQPTIKLSQALALESKPITLHNLFLAGGSSNPRRQSESHASKNVGSEVSVESPLLLPKESGVLPQSWLEAAAQILPAIEQSPAIFLLNPLAPLLFSESDLIPLCRRAMPSELCLFLSHKQLIAHLQAARRATPLSQTVATTLTALLRTDRWKALIPDDKDSTHAHEERYEQAIVDFIKLLCASLKRHFTFPVQAIPIPVLVGPATVENAPYTLLFATKRLDSLFCMNDAICRYHRKLEEESYHGVLSEEWFHSQQRHHYDQAQQQLTQRILLQGRTQRTRRWPDLRQHLLLTYFGQFLIQDLDLSMQKLLSSGEVSCVWRKAPQIEERDRVPGNEDTLIWNA